MIKAGIVGITGYAGVELFRILTKHPEVEIAVVGSQSSTGEKLGTFYPHLSNFDISSVNTDPNELAKTCDVIFTATPHGGASAPYIEPAKKLGKKIIDLSADFRLTNLAVYEEWYKEKNHCPDIAKEAVYGLPELHKDNIKKAWLVANPGCYTTASILANYPLLHYGLIEEDSIIVDAKSGVSGAGRKIKQNLHYSEMEGGISAYSIASHRHTPEIEQELSIAAGKEIKITFTPHLTPMIRGILATSYSTAKKEVDLSKIVEMYKDFYKDSPFVRIAEGYLPCTKFTSGTNYIDISVNFDRRTRRMVVVSSLDNMIKGASGQAVQNMNLMFGLEETLGLDFIALYP